MDQAAERELLARRLSAGADPLAALFGKAGLTAGGILVRARGYWVAARKRAFDANYQLAQQAPSSAFERLRAKRGGDRSSWDVQPRLVDFEDSFGRAADQLEPDVIHANDAEMLGVAVRAAARARAKGRKVAVVYDSHEYTAGDVRPEDATWAPVMFAQERKYIAAADGVVAAVDNFADKLVEHHGLTVRPTAGPQNMPEASTFTVAGDKEPGVRGRLGLGPDVTILVYPGAVTPIRGLHTAVEPSPSCPTRTWSSWSPRAAATSPNWWPWPPS